MTGAKRRSDDLPRFRAAAVQASPVFLDREATVKKACGLIREAAGHGAKLMVFPEAYIPTYPIIRSAWRSQRAKQAYAQLFKNSVEIPSPATRALCEAARRAKAYVAVGLNERDAEGGTIYNTILFIGKDGEILGKHRKLVPTNQERTFWGRGDGSTLSVFDTDVGRLGGLVCWEHWMPLVRYTMYGKGEEVHAGPTADDGEMNQVAARAYAYEGRVFFINCCGVLRRSMIPDDYVFKRDIPAEREHLMRGGSAIIGPSGEYLAGPLYDEEAILYADIDLERIVQEKQVLDVVGHYARHDIFRLTVNERRLTPLEYGDTQ